MAEQSDAFFAPTDLLIMTPALSIEILAQENLLQKLKARVGNLSQPDQLIKVCTDAGFLKTKPFFQILGGSDCIALSFFSSFSDRQLQALPL